MTQNVPNHHTIAVYTTMRTLRAIRNQLGLEAMLEFIERYTAAIETVEPLVAETAAEVLAEYQIEKVYQGVLDFKKGGD